MEKEIIFIVEGQNMKVSGKKTYKMVKVLKYGQVNNFIFKNIQQFFNIYIDFIYNIIFIDGARYEGSYLNGKKSGRGILLFADESKYIGEFEDNEISGTGEYYWSDGKVYKG